MSNPTNDAARWRKPEEELPEPGSRVQAWYLHPEFGDELFGEDDVHWTGDRWIEAIASSITTITCLAWRPVQGFDKPPWLE